MWRTSLTASNDGSWAPLGQAALLTMILSKWLRKHPDTRDLFDWKWYAARNGLEGEGAAWAHYSTEGIKHCLDPNPLFNSKWYHARHPESLDTGALHHFMSASISRALRPSPIFDSEHYLNNNTDVRSAGINPLAHYLKWGRHEGRLPNRWCDRAYAGDLVFDIELPASFLPDDMIGYVPHCSTLARLVSGAEASAFFYPGIAHWIFARHAKSNEDVNRGEEVAFIGGRREFLSGLNVFSAEGESDAPERHRAFQVRYAVSPIISNAISALGRDLSAIDELERLRHEVESAVAANPNVSVSCFNILVDVNLKAAADQYFSNSSLSAINVVSLEAGYLCRAKRPAMASHAASPRGL